MRNVLHEGRIYPLRYIEGLGNIGTESLQDTLLDIDGNYTSKGAKTLDESIVFFVSDSIIDWDDNKLEAYVRKEMM